MKPAILGLVIYSLLVPNPVSAQEPGAAREETSRERIRRETRDDLIRGTTSRDAERMIQLRRLQDMRGSRRTPARVQESAPANQPSPSRGTVRTQ